MALYQDDDIDQTYEVHLNHHLTPIEDHQEVNETIHYVYANGQAVADDHKARLAFHRTGEHDDVTGTDSWNTWIPGSLSFDKIDSPTIQGYTPDKASIDVMPVSAEDKDLDFRLLMHQTHKAVITALSMMTIKIPMVNLFKLELILLKQAILIKL